MSVKFGENPYLKNFRKILASKLAKKGLCWAIFQVEAQSWARRLEFQVLKFGMPENSCPEGHDYLQLTLKLRAVKA